MSGLEAIWLGLVQGVTEFFPVSSSGHLVLFQTLLGIRGEGGLLFEIGVHVATLVAIVVFYRQRIAELIRGTVSLDPDSLLYVAQLGVATLPAVAVTPATRHVRCSVPRRSHATCCVSSVFHVGVRARYDHALQDA